MREWAGRQMRRRAQQAYDRGDSVFVRELSNMPASALAAHIRAIESVGWALQNQQQTTRLNRLQWTLTFRRVNPAQPAQTQPWTGPHASS